MLHKVLPHPFPHLILPMTQGGNREGSCIPILQTSCPRHSESGFQSEWQSKDGSLRCLTLAQQAALWVEGTPETLLDSYEVRGGGF